MKGSRLAWGALLALVLLVGLVAVAPARLIGLVAPSNQIVLQGFSGTIWQGSAAQCLLRLPNGALHLGRVSWSLKPLSLVLLAPHVELTSAWGNQVIAGQVILRGSRDLEMRDLDARFDADLVRQFAPLALDGSLSVQLQQLTLENGLPTESAGRVVWQQAAWRSPQGLVPLGSYALEVQQPKNEPLLGEVVTLSGPLQASGTIGLTGRRYDIDLLLSDENGFAAGLRQALSLIANPEGDAWRVILSNEF
ncbi:MAG: type II secretion system protein N [Pseudomonadota bacterium]